MSIRNPLRAFALIVLALAIAVFATVLTRAVAAAAPLFAQPRDVPSVADSPPPPQYAAAVDRARALVRVAMVEQNLPGISVAVGAGLASVASAKEGLASEASAKEGLASKASAKEGFASEASAKEGLPVWAEGFGWRDVDTRTPVTPGTRFNIGTAASAVPADSVKSLGLTSTGAEPAAAWSPEHIGEPEEDFPPLTMIRHAILQPLGVAPAEYPLPGDRATFYVPRSDDNPMHGRRLMYMRDLACCAGKMASYSTASDLVRVGLANGRSVNGELAGGMVMSLRTFRDSGIVVVVLSNIAHANTSELSLKIGDVFAKPAR